MDLEDISLTAFCSTKTMDKLVEQLPVISDTPIRTVKYEIINIFESKCCDESVLILLKNKEYEKWQKFHKQRDTAIEQLNKFSEIMKAIEVENVR